MDGAAHLADRQRPVELLAHIAPRFRGQVDAPGERLVDEGERMDERTAVAKVDGEDLVAVRVSDAVAANALHRLVGFALIHHRLRHERPGADVVEPDLVVIGIGHLLNQVQTLAVVTEGVEAEVAIDLDADEWITEGAGTNQEIGDDATAGALALAR